MRLRAEGQGGAFLKTRRFYSILKRRHEYFSRVGPFDKTNDER